MSISFAALLFRPVEVSERALARGFAVALGGYDVPAPRLLVADLPGLPGWSAAFYAAGLRGPLAADEETEHAVELFEGDLPPALAVRDRASPGAVVYAIVKSEEAFRDDAWRFDAEGFTRRFVRDGDEGLEAGVETLGACDIEELEEADDGAGRGGSAMIAHDLGSGALAALVGALFTADRSVAIRFAEPTPDGIASEVRALNEALGRVDGRGGFEVPGAPALHRAFSAVYDFCDPRDPADLYRELSIGNVRGTLRFFREDDLAPSARPFPVAALLGTALGASSRWRESRSSSPPVPRLALAGEGDELVIEDRGTIVPAGPRFGELLRYLALGWKRRSAAEEDEIGALMLHARLRID